MGLTALAHCLVRLGRFEEAEATMQHNPGRLVDAIHPHHYERRLYLDTLAKIHEGLRRPEKAAEYRVLLREAEGADEAEASD